jgi:predicted nucleotidyltransferase
MKPSEALAKNRDKVLEILARYPVKNPMVFGSVARGEDTEDSDLDLLVEKSDNLGYFQLMRLEMELEDVLTVPVGILLASELQEPMRVRVTSQMKSI